MKNIKSLLAACAVLLVFGACGNGQQQNTKEDNKETVEITTPDLVLFDLQGPVKSCEMENDFYLFPCDRVEFDPSGVITLVDGIDPFTVKEHNPDDPFDDELEYDWSRDEKGQIVSTAYGLTGQDYVWENGRIAPSYTGFHEDMIYKYDIEYDAKGHVAKQTVHYAIDADPEDVEWELYRVDEFTYLDFDDHGNWTRCKVKYQDHEINLDGEEEITRKILYY